MSQFNKDLFSQMLKNAKGQRSINQYALHSGVSSAHISRLLRGLIHSPPTVTTILKLAEKAHNHVTYLDLMMAAGHLSMLPDQAEKLHETPEPYCCQQEPCLSLPVYLSVCGNLAFSASRFLPLPSYIMQGASYIVELADDTFKNYGFQKGDYLLVKDLRTPAQDVFFSSEEPVELAMSKGALRVFRKVFSSSSQGSQADENNLSQSLIGTIQTVIKHFSDPSFNP